MTFTRYKGFRIYGDRMQTYQILDSDDEVIDEVLGLTQAVQVIDDFLANR